MNPKTEKKAAARLAKILTVMCFRNGEIEDIHAGIGPVTKTGDYSDVKIADAEGNEIPWADASRIDDAEMKVITKNIVNRLYTYLLQCEDPKFREQLEYFERFAHEWDEPEIDPNLDCERGRKFTV
ncbi:MAG: hypothetical protein EOM26_08960 [Alphaproteobacteria bacterium]|nr:hypothetical protein [Alphaproteobacteria bacterium]